MQLHDLKPPKKSRFSRKRLGCGTGSGLGKTSGRGHKGQGSRSGGGVRPGFEGGQTPIYRRLPRRGFSNFRFTTVYEVVNVCNLAKFKAGTEVNAELLAKAGLIRAARGSKLKVLGTGEISVALNIKADMFSKSAESKITAAGGSCVTIPEGKEEEDPKKEVKKAVKKTEEKKSAENKETKKTSEKKEVNKETKKTSEKKEVNKETKKASEKKEVKKETEKTSEKKAAKKASVKKSTKKTAEKKEVKKETEKAEDKKSDDKKETEKSGEK